ncbi:FHA domain-containing protein [Massilia sp. TWR1-2-2]|uniref:FHA domain-containing protein n=1 Tax=Massilia sp. TWR1-2-2 TaxID=2804584 RepID=UPI003CE926BB
MSAPYFVETLARNGDVLHRHKVDALPIRLGRGYDNDFIVDDAHCAARHAIVEADEDGQLVMRDLGSKNGMVHRGKRTSRLVVGGDTVVRLGHTTLRVRPADFPVPAEQLDRTRHSWEGGMPGLVGLFLIGVVSVFTVWLNDTQSFQLIRYLQALAYGIGASVVWSGAWAFANRLFGRHARLGRHLFIFGCGLAAITVFKLVSSALAYAFSFEMLTRYGSHVAIMLAAGMLYFHLSTVKPNTSRRFAIVCVVLALLGSGLTLISNEQRSGRLGDELYMSVLMPPAMRVAKDHNVDEFMGKVNAMKAKLDAERIKKVKDQAAADDDD